MKKISFLVAAHNEEKIIENTLSNLIRVPYERYEVIMGLDGCTDKTEEIVKKYLKKSKKLKYYVLNIRQGKTAVINQIVKKASGDIIIIHDVDWIFKVKDKKSLKNFISVFNNPKVGGVAESFPIQYPLRKNAGFLERGIMIQTKIWIDYLKSAGKKIDADWIQTDENSHPLLVNIMRRNLYKSNKTLGDDFERFRHIIKSGKIVVATNNPNLPRMVSIGEKYNFLDLIKQKERTALARKQLLEKPSGRKLNSLHFSFYVIKQMLKMNLKNLASFLLVNFIFIMGSIKSRINSGVSTREGWKMRIKR